MAQEGVDAVDRLDHQRPYLVSGNPGGVEIGDPARRRDHGDVAEVAGSALGDYPGVQGFQLSVAKASFHDRQAEELGVLIIVGGEGDRGYNGPLETRADVERRSDEL